ncbi:MAG: hypothetical protein ABFR36_07775 [Acidobacteriota bacterium]
MKKLNSSFLPGIFLISILLIIFTTLSVLHNISDSSRPKIVELNKFNSDLVGSDKDPEIYNKDLSKKKLFIAYSRYSFLSHGEYKAVFFFSGPEGETCECTPELVSEKGKKTEVISEKTIVNGNSILNFKIRIGNEKEVEPRVKYISGSKNIILLKVRFEKVKNIFPAGKIFLRSLYLSPIFFFAFLAILYAFNNNEKWKLILAAFLTYTGVFLIIKFAWMSEDALITLRHVDNFLAGHGAVFNPGERVEGYTHTLWFWLITLLRFIGVPAKGALVVPGIIFSTAALYLLFFVLGRKGGRPAVNLSGAVLIGMSPFIDFGTSGLESSLSYLLLIIFSIFLAGGKWKNNPFLLGLLVTSMTFTRPDFGIFLIFGVLFYLFQLYKKEIVLKQFLTFLSSPVLMLGAYEIFRMGYYGAMFPNPFFAKSGGSSYFSQGFLYLEDLLKGSAFPLILLFMVITIFVRRSGNDFKNRIWILSAGLLYAFFVIRGGGDFMHGRFLLPGVILITVSSSGALDSFFERSSFTRISAVLLSISLLIISLSMIPVQKRGGKNYNHGIADERFAFYGNKIFPLDQIMEDKHIFMWKTIGNNYRYLTEKAKKRIRIAYHTVGFIGYYSGPRVNVLDRLGLTDPVVARRKIEKRGRPGHEKSAPFGYLLYRELTFGETPFKLWNTLASTGFGTLWDLSRGTLNKFSFFLPEDFKKKLDDGITNYLKELKNNEINNISDFLFFLKRVWYPYANASDKKLFNSIYNEKTISERSESFKWIEVNRERIKKWDKVIKGKLSMKKFLGNIKFALTSFFTGE